MKKFLYILATSLIVMVVFLSYQIISGQYDKQNVFIILAQILRRILVQVRPAWALHKILNM